MHIPKALFSPAKTEEVKGSLLFIHGMWSNPLTWQFWVEACTVAGYDCWAIDLRPKNINHSILDYVEEVKNIIQWIRHYHEDDPVVIAHSMGGLIAQKAISITHAKALILIASAAPAGISNLSLPLVWHLMPNLFKILRAKKLFQPSNKAFYKLDMHRYPYWEEITKELSPDSSLAAKEIMFSKIEVANLLWCKKTLVIGGSNDKIMPTSIQKKIVKKYNCQYFEHDLGHMIMLEQNSGSILHYILHWLTNLK